MNQHPALRALLAQGPVSRADHPELHTTIARALRNQTITAVLPGTYVATAAASEPDLLLRAAMAWEPAGVITGRAAAVHQFWPELRCDRIDLAVPRQRAIRTERFRLTRRTIPPDLVARHRGVRFTRPALTAADLCADLGGEVIDRALRSRKVTVEGLQQAVHLSPGRRGNRIRRAHLLDAHGNPWSYAERKAHLLLDDAGITGWRGNPRLRVCGRTYYPDILFDGILLVIEIDGRHHARNVETYQNDLWRMNDFILEGYTMLRYTLDDLEQRPRMFIGEVRRMQRALARLRGAR